jgi:hypothetical protein
VPGPSPEDLRTKYEGSSSKVLLRALRSKGQYTDQALDVIRSVLAERGVDPEEWNLRALDSGAGYSSSPSDADFLVRARSEIGEGRLWRAKEILGGNLPARGYDLTLYEEYGVLLAQMGDAVEAGRFLFLSGAQKPEYREPVQLYLRRFGANGWTQLVGSFPAAAKLSALSDYPESVQTELRRLGRPEQLSMDEMRYGPKKTSSGLGCGAVFGLLLIALLGIATC